MDNLIKELHKLYYIVAKNKQGVNDINSNNFATNNVDMVEVSYDEVYYLLNSNIFNKINDSCDLLIDIFEDETIDVSECSKAIKIVDSTEQGKRTLFSKKLKEALNYGTMLRLEF